MKISPPGVGKATPAFITPVTPTGLESLFVDEKRPPVGPLCHRPNPSSFPGLILNSPLPNLHHLFHQEVV